MHDTDVHSLPTVESVIQPRPQRPAQRAADPDEPEPAATVPVRVGETGAESITRAIAALVERGAMLRPDLARQIEARALLRFAEEYPSVRIDFRGHEIVVADAHPDDRAHDLQINASLPDLVAMVGAPLRGGLPRPTTSAGRAAIARLADGRVDFTGSLRVARAVLKLLAVA